MNISTKPHLPRRAFLKGTGALLTLPWFDAMLPAFATRARAAQTTAAPQRFIAINHGLGFHAPNLFPEQEGPNYTPSLYLKLLEEHRNDFTIISGLSHAEQNGQNGHSSGTSWLTGAKHPMLPGFRNTISIDQLLVQKLKPDTRFPFLCLGNANLGGLSWTAGGVKIPHETSASALYAKLFISGSPSEVKHQLHELQRGKSILDTVQAQAKRFSRGLGPRDQEKFDQYFTSIRDLETSLEQNQTWVQKPKPTVNMKQPEDRNDDLIPQVDLMQRLITLAFQTDSTRFVTYSSGGIQPELEGVDTEWHPLSHHGMDPAKIEQLTIIEKEEFKQFNNFLTQLKEAKDAYGPVLDNTHIVFGSNLGNASSHSWRDLPVILAGGGYKHGSHIVAGGAGLDNARFGNLFVQIANRMGVEIDSFGYSDGTTVKGLS